MSTIENLSTLTYPHDCPYVRKMADYAKNLFRYGTGDDMTRSQERFIELYHRGNSCPPTHVDGFPTYEWEDFVEITKY